MKTHRKGVKNSADNILNYFYYYFFFLQKKGFDNIMQIVSLGKKFASNVKLYFLGQIKIF